ncbi:hypothetical protein ACFLXW_00470 [Candidatus Dependentiae bacterium]
MSKKSVLSLLLFSFFLHAAELSKSNPDNNNEGLVCAPSSGASGEADTDQDLIKAIVLRFDSSHFLRLAMITPTERDFQELSEEKKSAILAVFPEFQTFLQQSDAAGAKLTKENERCDIGCRRIVVKLRHSISRDALPTQIKNNTIPGVRCSAHKHIPSKGREIDRILASAGPRALANPEEGPSVFDRFVSSVRERLQRD